MTEVVRVNFGVPMPVFPLPETVLLPHAIQPLHIFEPRYRQLVEHCLDGAGQFAMATFRDAVDAHTYCHGLPALRPAVCVGQIMEHDSMGDGRYNLVLHGVCRARIVEMVEPDGEKQFRSAKLTPLENVEAEPPPLNEVRESLRELLAGPRLARMRSVETVLDWFNRDEVSTHALLELVSAALLRDFEVRYRLLAEADVHNRARLIENELLNLDHLICRADRINCTHDAWPKGMSWN